MIDKFIISLGAMLVFRGIALCIFMAHREPFQPGEFRSFLWRAFLEHVLAPAMLVTLIWHSTCNWIDAKIDESQYRRRDAKAEEFLRRQQELLELYKDDPEWVARYEKDMKRWRELRAAELALRKENDR